VNPELLWEFGFRKEGKGNRWGRASFKSCCSVRGLNSLLTDRSPHKKEGREGETISGVMEGKYGKAMSTGRSHMIKVCKRGKQLWEGDALQRY